MPVIEQVPLSLTFAKLHENFVKDNFSQVFENKGMYDDADSVYKCLDGLGCMQNFKELVDSRCDYMNQAVSIGAVLKNMALLAVKIGQMQDPDGRRNE